MRVVDRVLEVIRQHPEGISTRDIARILYPEVPDHYRLAVTQPRVYKRAAGLAKFGLVECYCIPEVTSNGHRATATAWRPLP